MRHLAVLPIVFLNSCHDEKAAGKALPPPIFNSNISV